MSEAKNRKAHVIQFALIADAFQTKSNETGCLDENSRRQQWVRNRSQRT
jgi:hypothetical protein